MDSILGEQSQDKTKHKHVRCITMYQQCVTTVSPPPRVTLAYYGSMKCVSLLMVVTLALTSTPAYAYAATPVDGNDDISTAANPNCPTWLQWLCGKRK